MFPSANIPEARSRITGKRGILSEGVVIMKDGKTKKNLRVYIAAALIALGGSGLFALETAIGEDVDSMELRSIIVEGWEQNEWEVAISPNVGKIDKKLVKGVPASLAFDTGNEQSFGIRYQFIYPGNNVVTLVPPDTDKYKVTRYLDQIDEQTGLKKSYKVRGIELPGQVKAVSVWVLGRGNEYNLECWIEDWKTDTHIYKFGSLDFIGWRPLTVVIPENVPQDVDSYPQTKTLIFKRFVIRSTPKTSSEKVVLFFDSLKVLTDVYDVFFDGAEVDFDADDKAEKDRMKDYINQLKSRTTDTGSGSGSGSN